MEVQKAPDVQSMLERVVGTGALPHINSARLICMRSTGSSARAYARIWNLPRIWQTALDVGPYYVIEVLAEHFDRLGEVEKEKTLLHELMHIPKTFSGALVPHGGAFGKRKINHRTVEELYKIYSAARQSR